MEGEAQASARAMTREWCTTAQRLLDGQRVGERLLGVIAAHLALTTAKAAGYAPTGPETDLAERIRRVRNEVSHFDGRYGQAGRTLVIERVVKVDVDGRLGLEISWQVVSSSGRRELDPTWAMVTKDECLGLVATLAAYCTERAPAIDA